MAPVIAGGYAETPWVATPWSPAKITSRTFVSGSGGTLPCAPAIQTARSPSRPSAPAGVARPARRSWARAVASGLGRLDGAHRLAAISRRWAAAVVSR